MIIVGELINTSRKSVKEAVEKQDADFIKKLAQKQWDTGADYIDINCGTMIGTELEMMKWLVNCVQEVIEAPLCIDSPDPAVLDAGLSLCKYGQPMLNSISDEEGRFDSTLPVILKHEAKVVALCMDSKGMPETSDDRIRVAGNLYNKLTGAGVADENIFFDPLIKPVSSVGTAGIEVLESIRKIKEKFPKVHFMCGLSNISYGLPNRKLLNRLFVAQSMAIGMGGYVLDPTDKKMMGTVYASRTLLNQDEYNGDYLYAYRKGIYS